MDGDWINATKICYRYPNDTVIQPLLYRTPLECSPLSTDFNPCEDLLGNKALAAISWIVAIFAIAGNLTVIFTLLASLSRSRTQDCPQMVSKFLILNLAFGDFCMGVYLLTLSAMDIKSSGNYYNFGVYWQTLGGCDGAGFLSTFASQLSVFTLSVISMERW